METAQAIREAFAALLEKKPYDTISISEICTEAHVSRKTFYNYFENKKSIVEAQLQADFTEPSRQYREILPAEEIKSSTTLLLNQLYVNLGEKKTYYESILRNYGKMEFMETAITVLVPFGRKIFDGYDLPEDEIDFISYFFAVTAPASVIWWLDGHTDVSPKRMAKLVNTWAYAEWRKLDDEGKALL